MREITLERISAVTNELIASVAIPVFAVLLRDRGLIPEKVFVALLIFTGLPAYFRALKRAAKSAGVLGRFNIRTHGLLSLIIGPFLAFVVAEVVFAGTSVSQIPGLVVPFFLATVLFILFAVVFLAIAQLRSVEQLAFHEKLILVGPAAVLIPFVVVRVALEVWKVLPALGG